jgi:tetratricopeptide (TPR) repeat protein
MTSLIKSCDISMQEAKHRLFPLSTVQSCSMLILFFFVLTVCGVAAPALTTRGATAPADQNDAPFPVLRGQNWFDQAEPLDIALLRESIDKLRSQLLKIDKSVDSVKWAENQNELGIILRILGEQASEASSAEVVFLPINPAERSSSACESCQVLLHESISAFRAALEVRSRKSTPLEWAQTQYELGHAIRILSMRESGAAAVDYLNKAVVAFKESLKVYNGKDHPEQWISVQYYLGETLQELGNRQSGDAGMENLKKAAATYREALKFCVQEKSPKQWTVLQNNLGNTLYVLGDRENNKKRLKEAITAYRAALDVLDSETDSWFWATTQNNLGNTLKTLGKLERSTAYITEAIAAYRAALTVRTQEWGIAVWSGTQNNLANALHILGVFESGATSVEYLKESVSIYRVIVDAAERERIESVQASYLMEMGYTLYDWGARESDNEKLDEAISTFLAGVNILAEKAPLSVWATYLEKFGDLLFERTQKESEQETHRLNEVVKAYGAALLAYTKTDVMNRDTISWLQVKLGRAERLLKKRREASVR